MNDQALYRSLAPVKDCDGIQLEPSALAGLTGMTCLMSEGREYFESRGLADVMNHACHVPWATGGSMVPETEWLQYYQAGIASAHDALPSSSVGAAREPHLPLPRGSGTGSRESFECIGTLRHN